MKKLKINFEKKVYNSPTVKKLGEILEDTRGTAHHGKDYNACGKNGSTVPNPSKC